MADDGLRALERELHAQPPEGIRRLPDEHLHALADAVRGARHRQAAELSTASEKALSHIPRLRRGPVRKVLG